MPDPAQNQRARVAGLIVGFLAGDPYAREALPRETAADLLRIARRVAPDLETRGLADDVASEVFRLLLSRSAGHYDPDRGEVSARTENGAGSRGSPRRLLEPAAPGVIAQDSVTGVVWATPSLAELRTGRPSGRPGEARLSVSLAVLCRSSGILSRPRPARR